MARAREVILGVGGGIAAYKSCDLLRRLQDRGYLVTVVPTPSSLNFVGAATWEALSGRPVTTQVWERVDEVRHISLAKDADCAIIAPATADLIAKRECMPREGEAALREKPFSSSRSQKNLKPACSTAVPKRMSNSGSVSESVLRHSR